MRDISVFETLMGNMDMNEQLMIGLVRKNRDYEYQKIFRLHLGFMTEKGKKNPDLNKLTQIMKNICIFAHLGFLSDNERAKIFEFNRFQNIEVKK